MNIKNINIQHYGILREIFKMDFKQISKIIENVSCNDEFKCAIQLLVDGIDIDQKQFDNISSILINIKPEIHTFLELDELRHDKVEEMIVKWMSNFCFPRQTREELICIKLDRIYDIKKRVENIQILYDNFTGDIYSEYYQTLQQINDRLQDIYDRTEDRFDIEIAYKAY